MSELKATSESADSSLCAFPDDSFAVGPGAGDPLGGVLADQEAVTWAPHILAPRGGVPAFTEPQIGSKLTISKCTRWPI